MFVLPYQNSVIYKNKRNYPIENTENINVSQKILNCFWISRLAQGHFWGHMHRMGRQILHMYWSQKNLKEFSGLTKAVLKKQPWKICIKEFIMQCQRKRNGFGYSVKASERFFQHLNFLTVRGFQKDGEREIIAYNKRHTFIPKNGNLQTLAKAGFWQIMQYLG